MGRYQPPDGETTGSKAKRTKPATVRFEMPFAVWCSSCPRPTLIGQGVRFNAEKRRVGAYLTTPLWSFRFRHGECGGGLEIRTDPRNTAYVVVSGGTKRSVDDDDVHGAVGAGRGEEESRRKSAFDSLEKTIEHRERLRLADDRICGLVDASHRFWHDPYAQNQRLRRAFRPGRIRRQQDAAEGDRLREAMGLAFDLVPSSSDDARRAAAVSFGPHDSSDSSSSDTDALSKPLFTPAADTNHSSSQPRQHAPPPTSSSSSSSSASLASLASELAAKNRAARDPFLRDRCLPPAPRLLGVKRKRPASRTPPVKAGARQDGASSGLVQYDSD
ncbi:hypothetical protein XA68_13541 [Ophiocordyceps unilateralis]|uniref:Uncharacterized protein n=1 Tax=Ophiocordyceps unilateralis TaxID=268505 RepID=A0A2A9PCF9_OPHUN|nr:hypothetical protein XA68_13541 [Ophiocordyceps unilateralis]